MQDYKLLTALDAVLREQSFDKAAKRLHITQSAISQRIKLLEAEHGQPRARLRTVSDHTFHPIDSSTRKSKTALTQLFLYKCHFGSLVYAFF